MSAVVTDITDSLRSLIGNLGNAERDKGASLRFEASIIDDEQLSAAYRGNWMAKKLVNIPAEDALRKWRQWGGDHQDEIEEEERRLSVQARIMQCMKKARLFGGAAVYIGTDQDPAEPMDIERIGRGGVKHLTMMTRQELTAEEIERDPLSEFHGRPTYYTIKGGGQHTAIHPSRLVILGGDEPADSWQSTGVNQGWDESVLVATADSIKHAGGTFANVASLVFEANVDVIGVPDLMQNVDNAKYRKTMLERFLLAMRGKGVNGTLILDAEETYQRRAASFTQLPEIMAAFAQYVAAAADIPATRFLGQSPAGMNATGESDSDNYHDSLQAMQKLDIGPAMWTLDQSLVRSALGSYPKGTSYEWTPFKQMSEQELVEIGKATVETLTGINQLGVYSRQAMRKITTHKLAETKAFPHIEELITEGEDALRIDPAMLRAVVEAVNSEQAPAVATRNYLRIGGLLDDLNDAQIKALITTESEQRAAEAVGLAEAEESEPFEPEE